METNTNSPAYRFQTPREPVAIVGISCRFPHATTLEAFWYLLHNGRDTVEEIPPERWDVRDYYHADPSASGKTYQRHAALLERIDDFDPLFFGISPAEAYEMSPSQKLMLELVWEAIESSSMSQSSVQGHNAGVYVGNIWCDFEHLRKHKNTPVTPHSAMGQSANIIANRVSFCFGLTGPSLVVDTGCSSSLVALHLACQSLLDNSIGMAVVGAVNHILDPDLYILLSKFGGLSPTGRCHTFDSDADGFVRGEGGGIILLKKLSEAEKQGDKIFAVIRGSAINNNGYNVNLPATSASGQKQMLADAYAGCGISPHEVHYVEAHGTGTRLGDPEEARALGEFFGDKRNDTALRVGSVKTNIGHLEAAAGIAGLIKVVLAMQHRMLPPTLNYKTPNPNIPFEALRLQVQDSLTPWPAKQDHTLKAGINSFGWGGTNAHAVIEEYRLQQRHDGTYGDIYRYCLPLSARTPEALQAYVKQYTEAISTARPEMLGDICMATALRKPNFVHRAFFSGSGKEEMLTALRDFSTSLCSQAPMEPMTEKDKIVMVFPGQGSQWHGMGRDLYTREPLFRQMIEACSEAFRPYTDWSLAEQLMAPAAGSRLHEIDVVQPALFAMQVALAKLWMSWDVRPHAVVGHSMGEVAAACISGALSIADAARIICTRSRLMRSLSGQGGAMAVTELSLHHAETLVQRFPQLSIAANNSPKSTVLAGDEQSIITVLAELEHKNLFARQVKVDVASHSHHMDPLKQELHTALQSIQARKATIPFYSTVHCRPMEGESLHAGYWVDNLRKPVHFASVVELLAQRGHTVFIEISPHPVLTSAVNECSLDMKHKFLSLGSLYRDKPGQDTLYSNLGELFVHGYPVSWQKFYKTARAPQVSLPAYPFQRECYALESGTATRPTIAKANATAPLLGNALQLAASKHTFYWETVFSLNALPFLKDHQVSGVAVLPGAVYIEMVLEAAGVLLPGKLPVIKDLTLLQPLTLSPEAAETVQLRIKRSNKTRSFSFYKKVQTSTKVTWVLLAKGIFKTSTRTDAMPAELPSGPVTTTTDGKTYYDMLRGLGLDYGPAFQCLETLRQYKHPTSVVDFNVVHQPGPSGPAEQYKFHPAMLDACLQPLFFNLLTSPGAAGKRTTFLTGARTLQWHTNAMPAGNLRGQARLCAISEEARHNLTIVEADVTISSDAGMPLLTINGLQAKVIDIGRIEAQKEKLKEWLLNTVWEKVDAVDNLRVSHPAQGRGSWVVFGDPYGASCILFEEMKAHGFNSIHVIPGEAFNQVNNTTFTIDYSEPSQYDALFRHINNTGNNAIEGIVHFASANYTWRDPHLTAAVMEAQQVYGSISLLHLYHHLPSPKAGTRPALVVVTNGVQAVHVHEALQPMHSALWGMARVMANEAAHYNVRCFDLSANPSKDEFRLIVHALQRPHPKENEMAIRGAHRFVPRLQVPEDTGRSQALPKVFSGWSTYVVTGFSGMAFTFVEWMVQKGGRHFALVSRTGKCAPALEGKIESLRAQGCSFEFFAADVSDYAALETVFTSIEQLMPPVGGVVHAAGLIRANTLADLDEGELLQILRPKMCGAWNLHLLTQHRALDCFIMFSSVSSLIGLSGQASYVAANAFLDTLAHTRQAMGLPALAVNWGVIADTGMVARDGALARYAAAEGLISVPMTAAMEIFDMVCSHGYTQIAIARLHLPTLTSYYTALAQRNYLHALTAKILAPNTPGSFLESFHSLILPAEKTAALETLIVQQVAQIIKIAVSRINTSMTFKSLGIDSIMAIQLRNALEKALDLKLAVSMLWMHPSIAAFAASLNEALTTPPLPVLPHRNEGNDTSDWFVIPRPNAAASFRVFCFHDAGGDSTLYRGWETLLGNTAECVAIELPGRGKRVSDQKYVSLEAMIHELKPAMAPLLDKPYVCFGHSMGGLLAFEIVRALRHDSLPLPSHLFVSSVPALDTYTPEGTDHASIGRNLFRNKTMDSDLIQSLLKLLKDDLKVVNQYRYRPAAPLNVRLVALYGSDDQLVQKYQAERWQQETTHPLKTVCRTGGHRYIEHDSRYLTDLIMQTLAAT